MPPPRLSPKELLTGGPLKNLLPRLEPHSATLFAATLMLLGSSAISLVFPTVVGKLLDSAFVESNGDMLNKMALGMTVLFVVQAVMTFTQTYLLGSTGEKVVARLRLDLFGHLLKLPPAFFADRRTGELTSRLSADVGMLQGVLSTYVSELFKQLLMLIGAVVLLFLTHAKLSLVTLAVVPFVVGTALFFGKRLNKASLGVMDQVADATAIAEESFTQIRVVQSFTGEPHEHRRYATRMQSAVEVAIKRAVTRALFFSAIGFATLGASVVVLWLGGRMVLAGELTAGTLVTFLLYSGMVATSVGSLGGLWSAYMEATGAAGRVFELLGAKPKLRDAENPKPLPEPVRGEVVFEDVWFRYEPALELPKHTLPGLPPGARPGPPPGMPAGAVPAGMVPAPPGMVPGAGPRPVALGPDGLPLPPEWTLRGINLRVQPGETVAIVGRSGSGKTTMVSLISRFWDPQQGSITVDGIDLREVKLRQLRGAIGLVPQETLLFSGTIRDNILYGRPEAGEDEMLAAARGAHAAEFIDRLPEGYDTVVGERGVKLSGGQRQRIALARAMLKDPAILILDEATSSLDAESEALIEDALGHMLSGRTTFIIAHRLSTVRRANRLLVLEKGAVVEEGTHAELLAAGGIYASLYARQFRDDVADAEAPGEVLVG